MVVLPPTHSNSRSCKARSSRLCTSGGDSPISSRNRVPRCACSKRRLRRSIAVALLLSRVGGLAIVTALQSMVLFVLGSIVGARYPGGVVGYFILLISAILRAVPFAALSCALGLTLRKEESVIGAVNFVLLPLTFLSPVFMANAVMPRWIQVAARCNPFSLSVEAGRAALNWSVRLRAGPGALALPAPVWCGDMGCHACLPRLPGIGVKPPERAR